MKKPHISLPLAARRKLTAATDDVEGTIMKTRKQILIGTTLLLTILSTTITAQAGFFDWLNGSSASAADNGQSGSFDQLYAAVLNDSSAQQDDSPVIMADAVVPVASPTGTTTKTSYHTYWVQVSGYNSDVNQTDSSPFITASGTHVRDGVVASNMFPFGTIIKMPKLYGDKIFIVEDRMNSRYQHNVDIWFTNKADALKLGRQTVQIEVIK